MQVMFLFEEAFGMDVEIRGGKIMLVFDNNKKIKTLITSLRLWQVQKTVMMLNLGNPTADQKKEYELWKARFTPAQKNIPISIKEC